MKVHTLPKFDRQYKKLTSDIKDVAEKKFDIFLCDPFDSRLKTHKLTGALVGFLAFSINQEYRIIFDFDDKGDARFYQVGTHDIYN